MKEIGNVLKNRREEGNISLEEISVATKISVKHLQAIEEGNEARLPSKTFIRGFVQAYAKYIGMDVQQVMDLFHQEVGPTNAQTTIPVPEATEIEKSMVGQGRRLITGGVIVLIIIAIVVIERVLHKKQSEMANTEVSAITGSDKPLDITKANEATQTQEEKPVEQAAAPSNEEPKAEKTTEPKDAQPKEEKPAVVAAPPPPETTATPEPEPAPKKKSPQELIVEALDEVTIVVTIDGKAPKEVKMSADQVLTFKGKEKVELKTSNGGGVNLINNGFEIGVPGNLGEPKTMEFPR